MSVGCYYQFGTSKDATTRFGYFDVVVAVVMGGISLLTFGLDKAMLAGFLAYTLRQFFSPGETVNYYLLATTVLLIISARTPTPTGKTTRHTPFLFSTIWFWKSANPFHALQPKPSNTFRMTKITPLGSSHYFYRIALTPGLSERFDRAIVVL